MTFLPQLDAPCTFNVLVYADADSDVPMEWGDSDAKEIANAERVQLRGFSTGSHKVDTFVSYRYVLSSVLGALRGVGGRRRRRLKTNARPRTELTTTFLLKLQTCRLSKPRYHSYRKFCQKSYVFSSELS